MSTISTDPSALASIANTIGGSSDDITVDSVPDTSGCGSSSVDAVLEILGTYHKKAVQKLSESTHARGTNILKVANDASDVDRYYAATFDSAEV